MPTYEYACPTCGIVEVFQSIKEDALTTCPECKKEKVSRMIGTGGAVIFKGSGFWETDYNRSSDYRSKARSEKADGKEPAAEPPQSKSEAKPKKADAPAAAPAKPDGGGGPAKP